MKIIMGVETTAILYGVQVDIPDEVVQAGKVAMIEWANENIKKVDFARVDYSSTETVLRVYDVDITLI